MAWAKAFSNDAARWSGRGPLNHRGLDSLPPGRIQVTTLSSGTDEVRLGRGILQDSTLRGRGSANCFPFRGGRSPSTRFARSGRSTRRKGGGRERSPRSGRVERERDKG